MCNNKQATVRIEDGMVTVQLNDNGVIETDSLGNMGFSAVERYADTLCAQGYEVSIIDESRDEGM